MTPRFFSGGSWRHYRRVLIDTLAKYWLLFSLVLFTPVFRLGLSDFSIEDLNNARLSTLLAPLVAAFGVAARWAAHGKESGFKKAEVLGEVLVLFGSGVLLYSANLPWHYAAAETLALRPVLFCTDRKPVMHGGRFGGEFSEEYDPAIHYGTAEALVPWDENTKTFDGSQLLVRKAVEHRSVRAVQILPFEDFSRLLREKISTSPHRDAFVFVHGFRVPFDDAIVTTGKLDIDLKLQGAAIVFSWPSSHEQVLNVIRNYDRDSQKARLATLDFSGALIQLTTITRSARLHLFAHSLGTYVAGTAVYNDAEAGKLRRDLFQNIVFGAPDIEPEYLNRIADALVTAAHRLTVYCSTRDLALKLSAFKSEGWRAGLSGARIDGVDVIDATASDYTFIGHSYIFQGEVLGDIFALTHEDLGPKDRYDISPDRSEPGLWRLKGTSETSWWRRIWQ